MNKKTKKTVAALIAVLIFSGVSVIAYAHPTSADHKEESDWEGKWEQKRKAIREKVEQEIGMTQEQRNKVKTLRQENRSKMRKIRQELREKRQELKEEFQKDNLSEPAIYRLAVDVKELTGQLVDQRVENVIEARKVLTAEQFKKLDKIGKRHKQKRQRKYRKHLMNKVNSDTME